MQQLCSYLIVSIVIVNLLATSSDLTLTWTSPVLPKLHQTDPSVNPLERRISPEEESWIGSLINIGALIGPLPFGFLSARFGRKFALLSVAIPHIVSFLILGTMKHIYWYYFARILGGIALGGGYSILPVYIAEMSEDHNRGRLSVTLNIFWTLGNLIPYVIGPYLTMLSFNLTIACVPTIFFILFLTIAPETPYFLLSQNKVTKTEDVLMKLRSKPRTDVGEEVSKIQMILNQDHTKDSIWDLFKSKANLKALFISLTLMTFQQFSGINPIMFYTQLIFEESDSNLPPEICSIIIGFLLFLTSLIIPFFADSFGRRTFLITSSTGMAICLVPYGIYFHFKENLLYDTSSFRWLPIFCLAFYIVTYNLGTATMPWTISSELFSIHVKPYGSSLVSFTCWSWSFILTKFFHDLSNFLTTAGTFWLFGVSSFGTAAFTFFLVPETKGKSFQEINTILES